MARNMLDRSDPIKRAIWTALIGVVVLLSAGMIILRFVVLPHIDASENRVLETGQRAVSEQARALHNRAFVADRHADALLWGRDLRRRNTRGHVDIPRLRGGGVDLQVFSVVLTSPYAHCLAWVTGFATVFRPVLVRNSALSLLILRTVSSPNSL